MTPFPNIKPTPSEPLPAALVREQPHSRSRRVWPLALMGLLSITGLAFVSYHYRAKIKAFFQPPPPEAAAPAPELVHSESRGVVRVAADTPLSNKLEYADVNSQRVTAPVLTVAGTVVAKLAPGRDLAESRWDFASPEMATVYGDWIKARADVAFAQEQAGKVKKLVDARVAYLTALVKRQEDLVAIGTLEGQTLAQTKADKLQAEIQGSKDLYEANNAMKVAERNRGLLERQMLQAGIDPDVVRHDKEGLVLVVAEVPESKIGLVKVGQPCEARFYSYPDGPLTGRVGRIGPSVSKERRTLRVTFVLNRSVEHLLPGMYADVGLGTEERQEMTVPVESVLHAGKHDYVLVEKNAGRLEVREVVVEEPIAQEGPLKRNGGTRIIVKNGVQSGERVVASGAILLKPVVVKSLSDAAP